MCVLCSRCVVCVQPAIYHHPQVLFGRVSVWLLALRALHWSLWKLLPRIPLTSNAGQAVLCVLDLSAGIRCRDDCLGSAPGCVGQVVFLEVVGLWHSAPQRRKSRHLSFRKHWDWLMLSYTVI